MERGDRNVSIEVVEKFANALGVTPGFLLDITVYSNTAVALFAKVNSPKAKYWTKIRPVQCDRVSTTSIVL